MDDKQATNIAMLIDFETLNYGDDFDFSLDAVVNDMPASEFLKKIMQANRRWYKYANIKGRR
jgi:hypothetical protein